MEGALGCYEGEKFCGNFIWAGSAFWTDGRSAPSDGWGPLLLGLMDFSSSPGSSRRMLCTMGSSEPIAVIPS